MLAAAGLRRLGFASRISLALPAERLRAGAGPGHRRDRDPRATTTRTRDAVGAHRRRRRAAPRSTPSARWSTALGGGCQTPIGALAPPVGDDELELVAAVVALDGSRAVRAGARGDRARRARASARAAAAQLLADGAGDILAEARQAQPR